jgi:hypothetical protein
MSLTATNPRGITACPSETTRTLQTPCWPCEGQTIEPPAVFLAHAIKADELPGLI